MKIVKRNGQKVDFNPNKILTRLKTQAKGLKVDFTQVAIDTQQSLYDGITTREIDEQAAAIAASFTTIHPDHNTLAARILSSSMRKNLADTPYADRVTDHLQPGIPDKVAELLDGSLPPVELDYPGILGNNVSYSPKNKDGEPLETPSESLMRIAVTLGQSKEEVEEYYTAMTLGGASMASPVRRNAGKNTGALISCSLNHLKDDSRQGIHSTMGDIAAGSKDGAGIGLYVGNLRSSETLYANEGRAGGVVKLAKFTNEWMRFFRQSETRRGQAALYTDIWHRDVEVFLDLKNKAGSDETTTKDLFIALSVPSLFYQRVSGFKTWSLFCPHDVFKKYGKRLADVHGEEFNTFYQECEASDLPRKEIPAKDLMTKVLKIQAERGLPYIFNRDHANTRYNLSHLGTLKGLNLCIEFTGYHDAEQAAQCGLASVALHYCVDRTRKTFDYVKLMRTVTTLTKMLNRIIDINKWSYPAAEKGGTEQRNIGIGMAGLADTAALLDLAYDSDEFAAINRNIQEVMYYAAVNASADLAKETPERITDTIKNSPLVQQGQLTFDLTTTDTFIPKSDWLKLIEKVKAQGVINCLFCCNMPTASTSIVLGCNEAFYPFIGLMYSRTTVSSTYSICNPYMVKDLEEMGMWNNEVRDSIARNNSVQQLPLPGVDPDRVAHFKQKFKTVYEISTKKFIDMAADRQIFCDQSQSMNLHWKKGDITKMLKALLYGDKKGLTTGVYYTKIPPAASPDQALGIKTTVAPSTKPQDSDIECMNCSA